MEPCTSNRVGGLVEADEGRKEDSLSLDVTQRHTKTKRGCDISDDQSERYSPKRVRVDDDDGNNMRQVDVRHVNSVDTLDSCMAGSQLCCCLSCSVGRVGCNSADVVISSDDSQDRELCSDEVLTYEAPRKRFRGEEACAMDEGVIKNTIDVVRSLSTELRRIKQELKSYKERLSAGRDLELSLKHLNEQISAKDAQLKRQEEICKAATDKACSTLVESFETELTCMICQELMMDPCTISCSHSFCRLCIRLWFRKKVSCPVCRQRVSERLFKCLVIESVCQKVVESWGEEARCLREKTMADRSQHLKALDDKDRNLSVETPNDEHTPSAPSTNRQELFTRRFVPSAVVELGVSVGQMLS